MKKDIEKSTYSKFVIGGESGGKKFDISISPASDTVKLAGILSLIAAGCASVLVVLGYILGRSGARSK